MFTRMSKAVLWILGIAVFIGGAVGMGYEETGIFIWLAGFILLWGMGIYVEMINNIMDIKKLLERVALNNVQQGNNINPTYQVSTDNLIIADYDKSKWFCRKCGTENSGDELKCIGCGASAENRITSRKGVSNASLNLSQVVQQTENGFMAPQNASNVSFNSSRVSQQVENKKSNTNSYQQESQIVETSNSKIDLSQLAQQEEMQNQTNTGWFCRACGEKNSSQQQYCSSCGKYR